MSELIVHETEQLEIGLEYRLRNYGVKRRRKALGMTQKQLGIKAGASQHSIMMIEGFRQRPSPELRSRIAQALGCSDQQVWPDWLDVLRESKGTSIASVLPGEMERLTGRIAATLTEKNEPPAFSEEMREAVRLIMKSLSYREREVLKLRFGMGDSGSSFSLEECGKAFNCTRERIRQIEAGATRKIRERLAARKRTEEIA